MSNLTNNTQNLQRVLESLQGKAAGGGGGGGGGGIIEVLQLPTENIDNRYLYRVTVAELYYNDVKQGTTYVVAELPATGEPLTMDGVTVTATYYNDTDNTLYGYLPDAIAAALGVPAGWYNAETLLPAVGYSYGGVITNLGDASETSTFYLLLTNPLYSYEDGNWYEVATTGATLTLKTRVFRSWNEAIAFCMTHNVYEMIAVNLRIKDSGFINDDNFIIRNITKSVEGTIIAFDCYVEYEIDNKYSIELMTNYNNDFLPHVYKGYRQGYVADTMGNYTDNSLHIYTVTEVDGSNIETVTIYYFE